MLKYLMFDCPHCSNGLRSDLVIGGGSRIKCDGEFGCGTEFDISSRFVINVSWSSVAGDCDYVLGAESV